MSLHRFPLLLFLLLAGHGTVFAQAVTGQVLGADADGRQPLPGANVFWAGTTTGTAADAEGRFTIAPPPAWPARLVASFVGHANDTLALPAAPDAPITFMLRPSIQLTGVEVVERQSTTRMDSRSQLATEIISQAELKRAACCDLSESFETNATVDVNFSDAISGTKTIRMLGLDGKYAQMSVENVPFIRGLSTASGLTLIPGTWIKDINLSKGAGTAVNGPNAMTGQIDLCLLNPLEEGPLFVNLYGNTQGRGEANVHTAQPTGKHSANLLLVHGNWFDREMDQNNDGFMDMPRTRRINVMDRWLYQSERRSAQAVLRVVDDERIGGWSGKHGVVADDGHHHQPHGGHGPYTINVANRLVDGIAKHGWIFGNDPTKSIGLVASARHHEVNSLYGARNYEGLQQSFYGSAVYQQLLGTGTDQIKAGLSFQYDDYEERFTNDTLPVLGPGRTERMPGVFAEHTLKRERLTLVSGLRVDANDLYGTVASPRLHAKYDVGPLTTARLSVGHGFRTANPLAENAAVMASSRNVVLGPLGMERAWNLGASFLHKFKWMERKWAVGIDGYRTMFTAQVVADMDRSPQAIAFYMLDGPSYANSLLADVQVDLSRTLLLKASYRWYDVRTTYDGRLMERPFTPMHRGLIDLGYADRKERWRFDVTLNIFGEGRVPATASNPEAYRFPERSPSFATLHAQITRILGPWEFYLGGENLTSTLQQRQIIAPEDPFGPYFDASLIWGPTNLAMVYGGLRFTLERKKPTTP